MLFLLQIGCGGTGSRVARELFQQFWAAGHNISYVLADGARVMEKNLRRQNFIAADLGKNKAEVLLQRYSKVFPLRFARFLGSYLETPEEIEDVLKWKEFLQMPVIITCVDNNRSRQVVYEVFTRHDTIAWIDAGNGMYDGQACLGLRQRGKTVLPPSPEIWPDILADHDQFKSECGCADMPSEQAPNANLMSATAVVLLVAQLIQEAVVNWVAFNVTRVSMRAHLSKKEE